MSDRINVVIPTYDRPELLTERCLPSVVAQDYRPLTIWIANHVDEDRWHCTGPTWEAVRAWWSTQRPSSQLIMRFLTVPRRLHYPDEPLYRWFAGPVDPINEALRRIPDDEWIARIDDDDQWLPYHLSISIREAKEAGAEFVSSQYCVLKDDEQPYYVDGEGNPKVGGVQTWVYRSYLRFFGSNPDCWRKSWHRVNDTDVAERMRKTGVRMTMSGHCGATIRPRPGETEVGSKAYLR